MFKRELPSIVGLAALAILASPALLTAKRPGTGVALPDLTGDSIAFRSHCSATTCTVNNLTLIVRNEGTGDASNTRVDFYLSDDTSLTTTPDTLSSTTDTLLHTVALGTVKAHQFKKRTLGGGLLKQNAAHAGQYVIALLDADNETTETDEANNVFVSDPIP
jgi:subtilase family serine protease